MAVKKELAIIVNENIEKYYGVLISKKTYETDKSFKLIRFKCELTPIKKMNIKDTIYFTVASINDKDEIISSSTIEIDFSKFECTALIDTCLCGNKDIMSLNLYLSHVRPY